MARAKQAILVLSVFALIFSVPIGVDAAENIITAGPSLSADQHFLYRNVEERREPLGAAGDKQLVEQWHNRRNE
ncbi:hypothetical protein Sjap_004226 [Stephania japonica]|uniref:Uncharacterized protein n=1 Tax=Stephania japonica TaxID=461633 RepID=A0AAP0PGU8_9MAGN